MIILSKEEVKNLFGSTIQKRFKKSGIFLWRIPEESETILTIVAGKLETIKKATPHLDVIIRNIQIGSSAETYIIDKENFKKRYVTGYEFFWIDGKKWFKAEANGEVMAFCYHGETIGFVAPWGEKMLCEDGDFIAQPIGGSPDDIYRIEKQTFNQTYMEKTV
jgi:hypothetical protein